MREYSPFTAATGFRPSGGALRFAQNGAIVGLEIIVRPFNAMQAVGAATGEAPGVLHRFRELLATRLALTRRPT